MADRKPARRGKSLDLDSGIRVRVILQVYDPARQNYKGEASVRFSISRRQEARRIWAALVETIESHRPGGDDPVDRPLDVPAAP